MSAQLRYRHLPALEPDADLACRLTREDGRRRQADTGRLFSHLAEQRQTEAGNEFVFRGERELLWDDVSLFVDEESECCPFFSYEQIETLDSVILRVISQPEPIPLSVRPGEPKSVARGVSQDE